MFTLEQMRLIVSLTNIISKWVSLQAGSGDWDKSAGYVGEGLYERMALTALMLVFQSRADQDYMRDEESPG